MKTAWALLAVTIFEHVPFIRRCLYLICQSSNILFECIALGMAPIFRQQLPQSIILAPASPKQTYSLGETNTCRSTLRPHVPIAFDRTVALFMNEKALTGYSLYTQLPFADCMLKKMLYKIHTRSHNFAVCVMICPIKVFVKQRWVSDCPGTLTPPNYWQKEQLEVNKQKYRWSVSGMCVRMHTTLPVFFYSWKSTQKVIARNESTSADHKLWLIAQYKRKKSTWQVGTYILLKCTSQK